MEENDHLIEIVIEIMLRNAPAFHVKIEGSPSEKWFILREAHLAPCFSHTTADIMVNFDVNRNITMFFPEHMRIDFSWEPCVCSRFLSDNVPMPGWRQVCPRLTKHLTAALFENIAVLLQFVQNPILCGIHGCDERVAYEKWLADSEYELPGDKNKMFNMRRSTENGEFQ